MQLRLGLYLGVVHMARVHQLGAEPLSVRSGVAQRPPRAASFADELSPTWSAFDSC